MPVQLLPNLPDEARIVVISPPVAEARGHGLGSQVLSKTRILTVIVVLTQVWGDYLLSRGLHQVGSLIGRPPLAFIIALTNPWVALGVVLLISWLFSHMVLLSWADLSYVLPVTSIGYVLVALAGRFFLHESVSWMRWSGIIMIVAGVILVGRTAPSTHHKEARQ
jgi:drug/metabolite transporter (DMT)-like permease